jgi:hypothetical protein
MEFNSHLFFLLSQSLAAQSFPYESFDAVFGLIILGDGRSFAWGQLLSPAGDAGALSFSK